MRQPNTWQITLTCCKVFNFVKRLYRPLLFKLRFDLQFWLDLHFVAYCNMFKKLSEIQFTEPFLSISAYFLTIWTNWYKPRRHKVCLRTCASNETLRKQAYSNVKKISPPKTRNFHIKNSDIFYISVQNIDRGFSLEPPRRGGSNEYPQSLSSRNKKNNVYPCEPQFYFIKVGFKGVKII